MSEIQMKIQKCRKIVEEIESDTVRSIACLSIWKRANGAPDIQEKLFTPYFTTKTAGTGLGLAVCKQIVERHDGKIFVESSAGQGTSVFVQLPVSGVS